MQLWAFPVIRRLNIHQRNLAHSLTLSSGRAQSSQGRSLPHGLHSGVAVSAIKQTLGCGIYKRTYRQQAKDSGVQAVVPQPKSGPSSNLSTNRVVRHNLDAAKPPQAEKEKMLPENPVNGIPPSSQELEWQSGAGQEQMPLNADPLNHRNPNHSGATLITTHPAQWDSLVAQTMLSSSKTNITLPNNTLPIRPQGGDWSPKSGRLRPRATTKSHPVQHQGAPLNAPTGTSKKAKSRNREDRDPVTPPTAESGGIPEPTPAYLLRASFLPQTLPAPRPMLVIIDLNGTLLHRPSKKDPSRFVARPHAHAFLTYCINTFHVMIWSSARERNVGAMCDNLLTPAQRGRVLAIWTRGHFGLSQADYSRRVQCYKRLTRVWGAEAIAAAHPFGAAWDQGNTVLIDDSPEKARSEPFNAIQIPEFLGDDGEGSTVLPQVHDYLNTLACQLDISTYIRAHPFKAEGVPPAESVK